MKVALLFVADYATIDQPSLKLNALGVFDAIYTQNFPHAHNRLVLVVKLEEEFGDHHETRRLGVNLVDEDASGIFNAETPFKFKQRGNGKMSHHTTVLELNGLQFPHSGLYNFIISVDGKEMDRLTIDLVQLAQV